MSAFELAWDTWLFYSILGFVFCLITMKRIPLISGIYLVGGMIYVLTKLTRVKFGIPELEWKSSEYWKEVRGYLIYGQLFLTVLLAIIFTVRFNKKVPEVNEK